MALEIRIHPGKCIATRACINAAPHTFALNPTPIAMVIDPTGNTEEEVMAAADACPTGAITVFKDGARIA